MKRKIAVIGMGYVGLPLAIAFARKFDGVVGFDVNTNKISELQCRKDRTGEVRKEDLETTTLRMTHIAEDLRQSDFFVVAVPTPIDKAKNPDMTSLMKASETLGKVIRPGAIVVYESTVYPGVTEGVCGPIIEKISGLRCGVDFTLGYSPERINPGDKEHSLEKTVKLVSGQDEATLKVVTEIYGAVIGAGVYPVSGIRVAEAAKVIENIQRDLNIALMNELSIIFNLMGINTIEVLEAAATKWNFLPFRPGLVGGHCIGVDPYYLTHKAQEMGYQPQVILAGRRINDGMGRYLAQETVKALLRNRINACDAKVAILGLTFKEDVPDLRNSRVPDIVAELAEYGVRALVHDPVASADEAEAEYGIALCEWDNLQDLDAIILAVSHQQYREVGPNALSKLLKGTKVVIMDVKSVFRRSDFPKSVYYWSL
jgi:UDP-N-acetyl-D-galactosamine dehydrogenase